MAAQKRAVEIRQEINAPTEAIYNAFTDAASLAEWMCDYAQSAPVVGGNLHFFWNSGYYAYGEYVALKPAKKIAFTWLGKGETGPSTVKIILKPGEEATVVTLTHLLPGTGKAGKEVRKGYKAEWTRSLENLKSVLETGLDLRIARRPVLGLSSSWELTPDMVERGNLPVSKGIQIGGVVAGMGAEQAGLTSGDVIARVDGLAISGYEELATAVGRHQAGEVVKVVFYRGQEKRSTRLKLSARSLPEIPLSAAALAETVAQNHALLGKELAEALEDLSEEESAHKTQEGDWNIQEILAHLVSTERDVQNWILDLLENRPIQVTYHNNLPERIQATVAAYTTTPELLTELQRNEKQTAALVACLPANFEARKGSMWRLGMNLLSLPEHTKEHIQEIQDLRQSFANPTGEPPSTAAPAGEVQTKKSKRTASRKKKQSEPAEIETSSQFTDED